MWVIEASRAFKAVRVTTVNSRCCVSLSLIFTFGLLCFFFGICSKEVTIAEENCGTGSFVHILSQAKIGLIDDSYFSIYSVELTEREEDAPF